MVNKLLLDLHFHRDELTDARYSLALFLSSACENADLAWLEHEVYRWANLPTPHGRRPPDDEVELIREQLRELQRPSVEEMEQRIRSGVRTGARGKWLQDLRTRSERVEIPEKEEKNATDPSSANIFRRERDRWKIRFD